MCPKSEHKWSAKNSGVHGGMSWLSTCDPCKQRHRWQNLKALVTVLYIGFLEKLTEVHSFIIMTNEKLKIDHGAVFVFDFDFKSLAWPTIP